MEKSTKKLTTKSNNKNTPIIILLTILIIAIVCVGGYFIVRDIIDRNSSNSSQTDNSSTNQTPTPAPIQPSENTTPNGNYTPADNQSSNNAQQIEAGITYAERRGNDFYVEIQTNGAITGTCEITLIPTANPSYARTETDDLDVHNKVSTCDEDFSLKGTNPGEHLVRVIVNAYDGRSTTLEKTVNIQ